MFIGPNRVPGDSIIYSRSAVSAATVRAAFDVGKGCFTSAVASRLHGARAGYGEVVATVVVTTGGL